MPLKNGFEWMGLDDRVLRGVKKKGYSVPTPIQKKSIPLILDGRDVVAMARTGSGKTAAYLLPLFQHLIMHSSKVGIKGLILSPTRELAQQIFRFAKELGQFLPFRMALLTGGDSIEKHFSLIHGSPDYIIATPGRLLHLLVEMDLKLEAVSYLVLDEADRLFELGFSESLQEILSRVPRDKQVSLFSATLPDMLAEFATAKLTNPILIRLDLEHKLSPSLHLSNFLLREEDKEAALLHLIRTAIPADSLTAIFLPTRCHVEYFKELFAEIGLRCSYLYSSLDHTARKIQAALFFKKQTSYLLVTDIAARGIDIPWLDYVINYDLPPPKIFLHRVGRVARAGRTGSAFSLISQQETAYLFDLTLFLGYPLECESDVASGDTGPSEVFYLGHVPSSALYSEVDAIKSVKVNNTEIGVMEGAKNRAYKRYLQTKPLTNVESVRRAKEFIAGRDLKCHSLFAGSECGEKTQEIKSALKKFRPSMTIFEIQHNKGKAKVDKLNTRGEIKTNKTAFPSDFKDANFLSYNAKDSFANEQLSVKSSIRNNVLQMMGDEDTPTNLPMNKWDRKRKRFVNADGDEKAKKVRTESGRWIKSSYKTDLYKRWLERNKVHSSGPKEILSKSDAKSGKRTQRQPLVAKKKKTQKHRNSRNRRFKPTKIPRKRKR